MDDDVIMEELRDIRNQMTELAVDVAVLKNTRALAWKWGVGAGSAVAASVVIFQSVWSML